MKSKLKGKKLLKELGIRGRQEPAADIAARFDSLLHKLEPDAPEETEQLPMRSEMLGRILGVYIEIASRAVTENHETAQQRTEACVTILNTLRTQLEADDLTDDARSAINDHMARIAHELGEIDRANKEYLLKVLENSGRFLSDAVSAGADVFGEHDIFDR